MPNNQTKKHKTKYIFISGGVISSVGKGITTASIASLLESHGYKVAPIKCDPYLNVDAGTIRPQEHGEVFVTNDGIETDQDIGNYERFIGEDLTRANYLTNGQLYQAIIRKERNFEYDGEDVEIVPHVPEEIIRRCEAAGEERNADFVIIEIGGTVGEYQNILFIEANRIMKYRDKKDVIHIHVAYLPTPPSVGEMKSKPVQTSVRLLNGSGIQPDFIIGRAEGEMDDKRKEKLSWICNVPKENIISAPNADSIYRVPQIFEQQNLTNMILKQFNLPEKKNRLDKWDRVLKDINRTEKMTKTANIAVVGKYFQTGDFQLSDVYISVVESIKHASWKNGLKTHLSWVSSAEIEKHGAKKVLKGFDGVVVPGGFGSRGIDGIIETIKYVRENKVPYLGICYGMQLATIEFARNVAKMKNANTTEIDPKTKDPVIHIMPDQEKKLLNKEYGATMRLGAWDCKVASKTLAHKLYGGSMISERHRHRFEFNNDYRNQLEKAGLVISGTTPDNQLVEIIELKDHPYFIASQFHPEFKSRPDQPAPLFDGLIKAIKKKLSV